MNESNARGADASPSIVPSVVVHGGASHWREPLRAPAQAGCERAARAGLEVLQAGGHALDAAIAAVRALESDPPFNAGVGAVLTRERTFELDASVMNGADRSFGAVAAMSNIRHPIDVARAVLEDGEHTLLCAEGAWAFAREHGFVPCRFEDLATEHALAEFDRVTAERQRGIRPAYASNRSESGVADIDPGTVGACAIDAQGHVAAATSTGGMTCKRPGRIGDTPICGAGTFADDRGGAASSTGHGEAIMRTLLAHRCVYYMRQGLDAWQAAWRVLDEISEEMPGSPAGIICVDGQGRLGSANNTPGMPCAAGALRPAGLEVVAHRLSSRTWPDIWRTS